MKTEIIDKSDKRHINFHCAAAFCLIDRILTAANSKLIKTEIAYLILTDLEFHILFEIKREISEIDPAILNKFKNHHKELDIVSRKMCKKEVEKIESVS